MLDGDDNENNNNKHLLDASDEQTRPASVPRADRDITSAAPELHSAVVLAPTPPLTVSVPVSITPGTGVNTNTNNNNNGNGGNGYGNSYRCPPSHTATGTATTGSMGNTPPNISQGKKPVVHNTSGGGRSGRPPNINENSLQRRLECVLAVEDGMNMVDACAAYDISTRTFYRWLRSKPKLVELTSAAGNTSSPLLNSNSTANVNSVAPVHPVHRPAKRARHATPVKPPAPPKVVKDGRTRIEVIYPTKNDHSCDKTEIKMDRGIDMENKVTLNWYSGTTGRDIREAIIRRFGLKEDVMWGVNGADSEEVIVSPGMPSGKYSLFFSNNE